jgi:hypothetical protein
LAKQANPCKYASRSKDTTLDKVYWKNQNYPNMSMKKATKYVGMKLS